MFWRFLANNYDQATVQPNFPISSITDFEKELLSQFGFSYEVHGSDQGNELYFFAADSILDEIEDLEVDFVSEHAQQGEPIAISIQDFINENGEDDSDDYVSGQFSYVSIFQKILKKPECASIEDICIEGAYTCDKLRPGEFGGWVCRITRDSVQYDGTSAAFERMKKEPEFLAALNLVLEMASGNPLDELDVYDDPKLAADFKRQHHALDVIHEYLVLHPIAN
jgi:hypothetical protein